VNDFERMNIYVAKFKDT